MLVSNSYPSSIPLALYVHLPWCERKCPYCDFNSFEVRQTPPFARYVDALLADLERDVAMVGEREIQSVFFGGGTPSLFPGNELEKFLKSLPERLNVADDIEVTLEANPGSADAANFAAYREAGVNRLSIGVQSFRDPQLKALGRVHDANAAINAIGEARGAGFDNLNIDLMFGLPGDEEVDLISDIEAALSYGLEHISWYQLTMEPGTQFALHPPRLPSDEQIEDTFDAGQQRLFRAGYERYEVSAYAQPNRRCRHNLNYWSFGDYLGIGAGAHGKLTLGDTIVRTEKRRNPIAYMADAGKTTSHAQNVSRERLVCEFMLNALRLREGFTRELFEHRTFLPFETLDEPLAAAQQRGWLVDDGKNVRATELGFRFLNDLQLLFLA